MPYQWEARSLTCWHRLFLLDVAGHLVVHRLVDERQPLARLVGVAIEVLVFAALGHDRQEFDDDLARQ